MALACFAPCPTFAHQQPTTIVLLDVNSSQVAMELEIPLSELELAFGHDVTKDTDALIARTGPQLAEYLRAHIRPVTPDGQAWGVAVTQMQVSQAVQMQSGPYQEIIVGLQLTPPAGATTRHFVLNYDVIMHQVVTHKALVSIRNDWEMGVNGEHPTEAGVIAVNTATTKIEPLIINLASGSAWTGFKGMFRLGMQHIKEGTDHLLFLLVLLLPAPLLVSGTQWGAFGGTNYALKRLLKIVTAFTLGHSLTLLVGALGWVRLPPQPVEVLIAVSILVSAVHAVRPLFAGKEMYIAAGFGLVHGLAFASVLSNLKLGAAQMALSILGFNLGIELMQLFVIALVIPWLVLLSLTLSYRWFRIAGALLASVAAVAWIAERISGNANAVSNAVQNIAGYAPFGILLLAVIALLAFGLQRNAAHRRVS